MTAERVIEDMAKEMATPRSVEMHGETIEQAIASARQALGIAPEDSIATQVLQEPADGHDAIVRVTAQQAFPEAKPASAASGKALDLNSVKQPRGSLPTSPFFLRPRNESYFEGRVKYIVTVWKHLTVMQLVWLCGVGAFAVVGAPLLYPERYTRAPEL
ncbi:MAG TPA: hypothetical protein VMT34_07605, partial [Aggregatilineales bacterium]|nr:hypothetical protein [Aggregatilineales bacterium]